MKDFVDKQYRGSVPIHCMPSFEPSSKPLKELGPSPSQVHPGLLELSKHATLKSQPTISPKQCYHEKLSWSLSGFSFEKGVIQLAVS